MHTYPAVHNTSTVMGYISYVCMVLVISSAAWTGSLAARHVQPVRTIALPPRQDVSTQATCGQHAKCQLVSTVYVPSQMEVDWMNNIVAWQEHYCQHLRPYLRQLRSMLGRLRTENHTLVELGPEHVFSKFHHTYKCGGIIHRLASRIEPLVGALRNPVSLCMDPATFEVGNILSRDYLLLETQYLQSSPVHAPAALCQPRAVMFDLGASTYKEGLGGPSQQFLVEAYAERGITFDRLLLWDDTVRNPRQLFSQLPKHLFHAYQFFNIPVTANVTSEDHPLSILQQITTPCDFVVLKVDLGQPDVEDAILAEIIRSPAIHTRIDELMFDHHVDFKLMTEHWGNYSHNLTLAHSYLYFFQLRKLGIRVHGWP